MYFKLLTSLCETFLVNFKMSIRQEWKKSDYIYNIYALLSNFNYYINGGNAFYRTQWFSISAHQSMCTILLDKSVLHLKEYYTGFGFFSIRLALNAFIYCWTSAKSNMT